MDPIVIKTSYELISSIDEITQPNIQYAHISKPSKWIRIDLESDGTYMIFGMVCGDHPTVITNGSNMCRIWKTFKGAKNYLKICSNNGSWGMRHWNQEKSK